MLIEASPNNKASVRVLVSQPIMAYVGHMRWHLPMESLAAVVLPL